MPRISKTYRKIFLALATAFYWLSAKSGFAESYIIEQGDTLSEVLYRNGIGQPNSSERLYGPNGWIKKNFDQNPEITNWKKLDVGTKIELTLPSEPRKLEPKIEQNQTSELPDETIDKPTKKRADIDNEPTTIGSLGFRLGFPILNGDPLLAKTKLFGLFLEGRKGLIDSLRFYWDYVPEAKTNVNDEEQSIHWSRTIIGYAFSFNLYNDFLNIFLIPNFGRYSFTMTLPRKNSSGAVVTDTIDIPSAFNLGYRVDIEWNTRLMLARVWAGQDFAPDFILPDKAYVRSDRFGFDFLYNIFRRQVFSMMPAILLFSMAERITLSGKDPIDGQEKEVEVEFLQPYTGGGLSLTW